MIDFVILRETCKPCKVPLVRVKQTLRDDVVCPECWHAGEYRSVIVESAGLRDGWNIDDAFKQQVREAVRVQRAP
jgi:uncharacterized Zn finger protein (UPF0148 family)